MEKSGQVPAVDHASEATALVKERAKSAYALACVVLLEGAFVCVWLLTQWVVHWAESCCQPEGMNYCLWKAFEFMFAVLAFVTVAYFVIRDVVDIWRHIRSIPGRSAK